MPVTLRSNAVNGAPGRAHKPVRMHCSRKEPTVIKSIAMSACVAGAMLLAGADAHACGKGGDELLADPLTLQSATGDLQPAPKDQSTAPQNGK